MREVICIQLGQAGIRMGDSFWKQLYREYWTSLGLGMNELGFQTFFSEKTNDDEIKFIPRTLFVDLEPHTSIGHFTTELVNRELYDPSCLLFGNEGGCCTFSRGSYGYASSKLIEKCKENIRKLVKECNTLEGFIIFSSCSGGTSSGLCSQLLQHLSVEYPKKMRTCFTLFPTLNSKYSFLTNHEHVVEPYNAVLSMNDLVEYCDLVMTFDNAALYNICKRSPHLNGEVPNIIHMNGLISEVASSLTSAKRFRTGYGIDLNEVTILLPYPRFHFFQTSYISNDFLEDL